MHLRLLQQKYRGCIGAKQFGYNGQCLADAVTYVNQITLGPFRSTSVFLYMYLKGSAFAFSERLNRNFIEKTRFLSKIFEGYLELYPLLRILPIHTGEKHGDVISTRITRREGRVIRAMWLGTNRGAGIRSFSIIVPTSSLPEIYVRDKFFYLF